MCSPLVLSHVMALIHFIELNLGLQNVFIIYYDYLLSKAQRKFGDEVLALKLRCCHGQLSSFPLVTMSSAVRCLSRGLKFHAFCR